MGLLAPWLLGEQAAHGRDRSLEVASACLGISQLLQNADVLVAQALTLVVQPVIKRRRIAEDEATSELAAIGSGSRAQSCQVVLLERQTCRGLEGIHIEHDGETRGKRHRLLVSLEVVTEHGPQIAQRIADGHRRLRLIALAGDQRSKGGARLGAPGAAQIDQQGKPGAARKTHRLAIHFKSDGAKQVEG